MILQELKKFYDRHPELPRFGFEEKEIPFILTLSAEGEPVRLESTFIGEGRKRRVAKFLVPHSVKRARAIAANLLWDNPEYALGIPLNGKPDDVELKHNAFVELISGLGAVEDAGLRALRLFLEKDGKEDLLGKFPEALAEMKEGAFNVTFKLDGEPGIIIESPRLAEAIKEACEEKTGRKAIGLITGEMKPSARLHHSLKGIPNATPTGANIVSFNAPAFCSDGNKQGDNAPISEEAAFSYVTALNHLLGKDSPRKVVIGDTVFVFWTETPEDAGMTEFELGLKEMLEGTGKEGDGSLRMVRLLTSFRAGEMPRLDGGMRFNVLGLSANASRISVRLWRQGTLRDLAVEAMEYFRLTALVHHPDDLDCLPLSKLLISTAAEYDRRNLRPGLAGETVKAILSGLPWPKSLFQAALARIKAERKVTYARAATLRACLNSAFKHGSDNNDRKEISVGLDKDRKEAGYLLGRLFSTLEKLQEEAHGKSTLRERTYGAACCSPASAFGGLLRMKNHHVAKLDSAGRKVQFERMIGEIMAAIDSIPLNLDVKGQALFALGYYHQRQDFFVKKADREASQGQD